MGKRDPALADKTQLNTNSRLSGFFTHIVSTMTKPFLENQAYYE